MVKVIELPEVLREVCSREIWIPESECSDLIESKKLRPKEDESTPQRKLDLGTPF